MTDIPLELLAFGDLPFDGKRPAISPSVKFAEEFAEMTAAFSETGLMTEFLTLFRTHGVLAVHVNDFISKRLHEEHRILIVVEEEVGRIEIQALVFRFDIGHGPKEKLQGSLTGFISEHLSVRLHEAG